MNNDTIQDVLVIILFIMITILILLGTVFVVLKMKQRTKKTTVKNKETNGGNNSTVSQEYNLQSIFKFMEFDNIQDNMIIQNNGKRFIMVVQCQGVNYDLMSQMEKVSVEEGFLAFLNTLRHPIQIYVQTRTVNLESSIATYKKRIKEIEEKLERMKSQYEIMQKSEEYSEEELNKAFYEITKQTNLYEYGKDIIYNTEKLSQNKNILNKSYYIIIPFYPEEANNDKYDKEEVLNIAFSELYTKAQSVIRTLSSTGVTGKILNSNELAELLYIAYNRDEAEVFNLQKAISAGCEDIYTTGKDILDKKIQALDKEIETKAFEKAKESIEEARALTEKEQEAKEKEENMDMLIKMMAEMMLEENKQYIGEDITEKAKEIVNKPEDEEEDVNVQEKTRRSSHARAKKVTN